MYINNQEIMKTSLVITTINSPNKNIRKFVEGCKKKNWKLVIIGDKKTPNNFKLRYGDFVSYKNQLCVLIAILVDSYIFHYLLYLLL